MACQRTACHAALWTGGAHAMADKDGSGGRASPLRGRQAGDQAHTCPCVPSATPSFVPGYVGIHARLTLVVASITITRSE